MLWQNLRHEFATGHLSLESHALHVYKVFGLNLALPSGSLTQVRPCRIELSC